MDKRLDDYDWEAVFTYVGAAFDSDSYWSPTGCGDPPACVQGCEVPTTPFGRDDVAEIVAMSEGENDGDEWLIAGRLEDGRFFYIEAGCDYTGWD